MARYLETAEQLKRLVNDYLSLYSRDDAKTPTLNEQANHMMAVELGHLLNLAVRCNPRQSQGTVRKNIVAKAMEDHCIVSMTKETDEQTGNTYNKIHIK